MLATKAKYKVGDYVVADNRVFLKILAVIEAEQPVYAVTGPKNKDGEAHWMTEFELDDDKLTKIEPEFEEYYKLQAGDILHMGHSQDREYTTVLARAGDLVLLSMAPHTHEIKQITKLADQLKELTDGELDMMEHLDNDTKEQMRKHSSSKWARQTADRWRSVEWVCLMNWPIVKE